MWLLRARLERKRAGEAAGEAGQRVLAGALDAAALATSPRWYTPAASCAAALAEGYQPPAL